MMADLEAPPPQTPPEHETSSTTTAPTTALPRDGPADGGAAVLAELAAAGATGVLRVGDPDPPEASEDAPSGRGTGPSTDDGAHAPGGWEGIALRDGRVVAARVAWVPTPAQVLAAWADTEGRRPTPHPITWARVRRESMLDAATAVLSGTGPPRFDPGLLPEDVGADGAPGRTVDRVLAEVARRRRLLGPRGGRHGTDPDAPPGPWTRLRRTERLTVERLRLTPQEWSFLGSLGAAARPVDIAHRVGCGIVEAVIVARRLWFLGLVCPDIVSAPERMDGRRFPLFLEDSERGR